MALQSYTIAVGNLQDDTSGNNYAVNKAVYILKQDKTIQPIFSDLEGDTPITQDGVNNVTNNRGEFSFFVEPNDYIARVGGVDKAFSVVGSDYFNNKVDDAVNLIIDSVAGRGAYYPVGSFEAGFTYTDINQVGTFGTAPNITYYVYTGGLTNLPHTVPAGTDPTSSDDYENVFYTDHNALTNRNEVGAHDDIYIRSLDLSVISSENPPVGTRYKITDLNNARYDVVSSSDTGGFYLLTFANGNKLKYVVGMIQSPEHFGCVGDPNNIINEHDSLQACFNFSSNLLLTKDKIYGNEGTLELPSNLEIHGFGEIRQLDETGNLISATSKTNIKVCGGKYTTNITASGSGYESNALFFNQCEDIDVLDAEFETTEFSNGMRFAGVDGFNALRNKIYCHDTFDPTTLGSLLPEGISIVDGSKNGVAQCNKISNTGIGINIQAIAASADLENIDVSYNTVDGASGYGILSYRLGSIIKDVTISYNKVKNIYGTFFNTATSTYTHGAGIYLQSVDDHKVNFNTVTNCCVYTNGETLAPAGIGTVYSLGNGDNNEFIGNKINGSGKYGMLIDGNNNKVIGGTIQGTAKASFYSRTSKDLSVVDLTTISTTGQQGALFVSTAGGTGEHVNPYIENLKATGSAFGIQYDGFVGGTIKECKIYSTGVSGFAQGIGSTSNCDGVEVHKCIVEAEGGFGIRYTGTNGTITWNDVSGATQGQSVVVNAEQGTYVDDNKIDNIGAGDAVLDVSVAPATVMALPYASKNILLNVSAAGDISGIDSVPDGCTVTLRVLSGTTIRNLNGVTGDRFRFADGNDRVTTRSSFLTFVKYFSGVLDCTSEML